MGRGFAFTLLFVIVITASAGYLQGMSFPKRAIRGTVAEISLSPTTIDYDLLSRESLGKGRPGAGVPLAARPPGFAVIPKS